MAYAPAKEKAGEITYHGLVPGWEAGWALLAGTAAELRTLNVDLFRYVAT